MGKRHQRIIYGATTFSVVLIMGVAVILAEIRKFVPRRVQPELAASAYPFVQAAATQDIRWRELSADNIAEARRTGMPMMVVVGDRASRVGRLFDDNLFGDDEVSELVNRSFIPIRVDLTVFPTLASCWLPLTRSLPPTAEHGALQTGFDPTFQIWFLNAEGQVYASRVITDPVRLPRASDFLRDLRWAVDLATKPADAMSRGDQPGERQRAEGELLLESQPPTAIDFSQHVAYLEQNVDPVSGAWPLNGLYRLNPASYEFLLTTQQEALLRTSLGPVVRSAIVDWIGGGFFYQARQSGWQNLDYDKYATLNADMMVVCAKAYLATGERIYAEIAHKTFELLDGAFSGAGQIVAYRQGDEAILNRSLRSSFSPWDLRGGREWNPLRPNERSPFQPEGLEYLRQEMGLDPRKNPAMIVHVARPETLNWARFRRYLGVLREMKRGVPESYSPLSPADVACSSVARMLETARLLNDEAKILSAVRRFSLLQVFRSGLNDVVRLNDGRDVVPATLGDYLAYADASLQVFTLTGDRETIRDGFRVLLRAIEYFDNGNSLSAASPELKEKLFPDTDVPEVVDRLSESNMATAIRLAHGYGAAAEALGRPEGARLRSLARRWMLQFAGVAQQIQRRMSGYFRASWLVEHDAVAVVTGPGAEVKARHLGQKAPSALILPIPESNRPAGHYLLRGSDWVGPMDAATLAQSLREALAFAPRRTDGLY